MHVVTMLKSKMAADDNTIHPQWYLKGRTYTVSDYLLQTFIADGAVVLGNDPETYFEHEHMRSPEDRMDRVLYRGGNKKGRK